LKSLRLAGKIIRDFSPDAVVGVGGYASGPVLQRAANMGIPTLIQEQNSYAGLTNRLLARKADRICVAYDGMERYFPPGKLVLTGNPVRKEIAALAGGIPGSAETIAAQAKAREDFGIGKNMKVLLVLGGSLGARTMNQGVMGNLDRIMESGTALIWQCGQYYYREARETLQDLPEGRIVMKDFIRNMGQAYKAATVIVARAGAITISELCLVGKPSVLVPSPNVAEDHQTRNARALEKRTAAVLIPDSEAVERMIPEALALLKDQERMDHLSGNIASLAIGDSAERIAREIIGIME
jgi:UDP-N-acetylglucosamine--N-acetylmuramyl-(pentapeptide) pyrophosphoryl-undecaprenol N-acetylglucosamine transferase